MVASVVVSVMVTDWAPCRFRRLERTLGWAVVGRGGTFGDIGVDGCTGFRLEGSGGYRKVGRRCAAGDVGAGVRIEGYTVPVVAGIGAVSVVVSVAAEKNGADAGAAGGIEFSYKCAGGHIFRAVVYGLKGIGGCREVAGRREAVEIQVAGGIEGNSIGHVAESAAAAEKGGIDQCGARGIDFADKGGREVFGSGVIDFLKGSAGDGKVGE